MDIRKFTILGLIGSIIGLIGAIIVLLTVKFALDNPVLTINLLFELIFSISLFAFFIILMSAQRGKSSNLKLVSLINLIVLIVCTVSNLIIFLYSLSETFMGWPLFILPYLLFNVSLTIFFYTFYRKSSSKDTCISFKISSLISFISCITLIFSNIYFGLINLGFFALFTICYLFLGLFFVALYRNERNNSNEKIINKEEVYNNG